MADSKRLQILKALTAQLQTITVANGFNTDIGNRVYRGRPDFGSETDKPFIGIFEIRPEGSPLYADTDVEKDNWSLGIQGVVEAGTEHPTDPAHNLLADIKRALSIVVRRHTPVDPNPYENFGGLITGLEIDGGVTYVAAEDQSAAVCVCKLDIGLVEELGDLYSDGTSYGPGVDPTPPSPGGPSLNRAPDYDNTQNIGNVVANLKAWFFPDLKMMFVRLSAYSTGSIPSDLTTNFSPLPSQPDLVGSAHLYLRTSTYPAAWPGIVAGVSISSQGNTVFDVSAGANLMMGATDTAWYKMK